MRALISGFTLLALPLFSTLLLAASANPQTLELVLHWGSSVQQMDKIALREQLSVLQVRELNRGEIERWAFSSEVDQKQALLFLQKSRYIEWVEPNIHRTLYAVPSESSYPTQLWGLEKMKLPQAWEITTGNHQVVVAVLDDSVEINHPDLAANIWVNEGEVSGNGVDDDGNGYVDDVHGWDFRNGDNDPSADLKANEGHGTAVAGVLGAVGDNGIGTVGVAWNVSIMPLKFGFDVASGLEAVQYAIENGADILVTSFGGPAYSNTENLAMQLLLEAGVLVVSSAGNDHADNDRVPDYPSSADFENIIAVAASGSDERLTEWSSRGQTSVDLMAPGEEIYTTQKEGYINSSGLYGSVDGTSFSAPYVAGIAALLKSNDPSADFRTLKARILASVTPLESARGKVLTGGQADAFQALEILPHPLLTIHSFEWFNVIGDGDQKVDPGELLELNLELHNGWIDATGVTATLSTQDQLVDILWDEVIYPDLTISQGLQANPEERFLLYFRPEIEGHKRVDFILEITSNEGVVKRYFQLELGVLRNGELYQEVLQQSEQDDFHVYHIDFPEGASNLRVETTADQGVDLDLLLADGEFPQFVFTPEGEGGDPGTTPGPMSKIDGNESGNEQIEVFSAKSQMIEVVIINFSQSSDEPYTVRAIYDGSDTAPVISPSRIFRLDQEVQLQFPGWQSVVAHQYRLQPGWNLIAFPVALDKDSVRQLLRDFPEIDSVWGLEAEGWTSAINNFPEESQTLEILRGGQGYWLRIDSDEPILAVVAGEKVSLSVADSQWQIIGVSDEVADLNQFLQQHQADSIWSWGEGRWKSYQANVPVFLNTLNHLEAGVGYYLRQVE